MNVSKIYNFNVIKSGVAPFGENVSGETRNYAEERRRSEKKASDFLKGAVTVSAVILAAAYAAKHGVFRRSPKPQAQQVTKPVEPQVTESIQEIFARRSPVAQTPAKYTRVEVPVEGNRAERLSRNSIDDLIPVSLVDIQRYKKCKNSSEKSVFWREFQNNVANMSYRRQYEALSCFLDFIKTIDPSEVTATPVLRSLKRDNYERFMQKIMEFTEANPDYHKVFWKDEVKYADNYKKYLSGGEKLDLAVRDVIFPPVGSEGFADTSLRNDFCRNSLHLISTLPEDKQISELKSYFDFIKKVGSDRLKGISILNMRYFSQNNLESVREAAAAFANENPGFKHSIIEALSGEFIDYSKKSTVFADEIKAFLFGPAKDGNYVNLGRRAAFFTNSENYIAKQSPENQVGEFKKYLDFIRSIDAEQVKDSILFIPGKFAGENNLKIAQEAINFAKNNPQYKDTIVSNLVSYEPDAAFALRLSGSKFRLDAGDYEYNMHADNIIKIRRMLMDSGLVCDTKTRLKNRQDWLDQGFSSVNQYMLGFQYSPKITDIRRAAFEYDMKQGITRAEADEFIEMLTSADTIIKKRSMADVLEELNKENIPSDKAQNLFNQLIENKSRVRQKAAEVDWSQVAEDKIQPTTEWLENSIAEINSGSDKVYQEFEQMGLSRERAETMLQALTTPIEHTNTELKYGMTLDEMIAKINNSVIS